MAKRIGEPYDPEMRTSEHGSRLYGVWRRIRKQPHCEVWESYKVFYTWSVYNGYSLGAYLRLVDEGSPYGPDNCEWYTVEKDTPIDQKRANEWNAVVNRIRKNLGMPPLEGTNFDNL